MEESVVAVGLILGAGLVAWLIVRFGFPPVYHLASCSCRRCARWWARWNARQEGR